MIKAFTDWWNSDPKARFYVRTFVVGAITYVVSSLATGIHFTSWHSFAWGAAGAGAKLIIGYLTPEEPFVGHKAKHVKVPVSSTEEYAHGQ